jgi:3-methylcrotonyl-CoA carboxylase alpha subunit
MGYDFDLEDQASIVHPAGDRCENPRPNRLALSIDGVHAEVALTPGGVDGEFTLEIDGRSQRVFAATDGESHFIHLRGRTLQVKAINALERAQQAAAPAGGDGELRAPMPGVVVEVNVEVGVEVETGQLLLTIESMKLQTAIVSPHHGRVAEISLPAGASFEQGTTLVRIEAIETAMDEDGEDGSQEKAP